MDQGVGFERRRMELWIRAIAFDQRDGAGSRGSDHQAPIRSVEVSGQILVWSVDQGRDSMVCGGQRTQFPLQAKLRYFSLV